MPTIKTRLHATAAACIGAMLSTAAMAVPVTQWSYSTNATFTSVNWTNPPGTPNGTNTALPHELSWGGSCDFTTGAGCDRSALTIGSGDTGNDRLGGGPVTGTIDTTFGDTPSAALNQIGQGISITHWNNTISSGYIRPAGGVITDTLTLNPIAPNPPFDGTDPQNLTPLVFTFVFRETPNDGGDGGGSLCADGTSAGSWAGGCPDLFGLDGTVTLNQPFSYDGTDYFASIFILGPEGGATPIGTLSNGECRILGLSNGCQGFRTIEEAQTTAQFYFAVTTDRITFVPEPSTLALLGLGLAGLGFASRRRKV